MKWNSSRTGVLAALLLVGAGGVHAQQPCPLIFEGTSLSIEESPATGLREVLNVEAVRFDPDRDIVVRSDGRSTTVRLTCPDATKHTVIFRDVDGVEIDRTGDWARVRPSPHHAPDTPVTECCTCQSFLNFSDDAEAGGCVPGCLGCSCSDCVCTPWACFDWVGGNSPGFSSGGTFDVMQTRP